MTHKLILSSLCLAATLAAFPAVTQAKGADLAAWLKAQDPDNDGTLDMAEIKKAAEAKFDRLEKDKDGTLDRKEVHGLGISKADFAKADPDKDGTLDKPEYLSIVEARFKVANPDNDGTVDLKELQSPAGRALLKLIR